MTKRKTSTYSATAIKLSAHEKLCAERMNTIIKSVEQLRKDVSELKANVNKGKGVTSDEKLAQKRAKESIDGLKNLSLPIFLNLPDGGLGEKFEHRKIIKEI